MRGLIVTILIQQYACASHAFGSEALSSNVGFSTGRLEQDNSKDDYDLTGKTTRGLSYSGLKVDLGYRWDMQPNIALFAGVDFVTAFESLNSARFFKNGAFVAPIYYMAGGPRTISQGRDLMVVEERASWRLLMPFFVRYETIDYVNSVENQTQTGVTQSYSGTAVNIELALQYEKDLFKNWSMGLGMSYRIFGIPMSKSKTSDRYYTMSLSVARQLNEP